MSRRTREEVAAIDRALEEANEESRALREAAGIPEGQSTKDAIEAVGELRGFVFSVTNALNARPSTPKEDAAAMIRAMREELFDLRETVDAAKRTLEALDTSRGAITARAMKVVDDVKNLRDMHAKERDEAKRLAKHVEVQDRTIDDLTKRLAEADRTWALRVASLETQVEEVRRGLNGAARFIGAMGARSSWD